MKKPHIIFTIIILIFLIGCEEELVEEPIIPEINENVITTDIVDEIEETPKPEVNVFDIFIELTSDRKGRFEPNELTLKPNQKVIWTNNDQTAHIIACYKEGRRVYLGQKMIAGDSSEFNFTEKGEYICLDTLYEARSKIYVE